MLCWGIHVHCVATMQSKARKTENAFTLTSVCVLCFLFSSDCCAIHKKGKWPQMSHFRGVKQTLFCSSFLFSLLFHRLEILAHSLSPSQNLVPSLRRSMMGVCVCHTSVPFSFLNSHASSLIFNLSPPLSLLVLISTSLTCLTHYSPFPNIDRQLPSATESTPF